MTKYKILEFEEADDKKLYYMLKFIFRTLLPLSPLEKGRWNCIYEYILIENYKFCRMDFNIKGIRILCILTIIAFTNTIHHILTMILQQIIYFLQNTGESVDQSVAEINQMSNVPTIISCKIIFLCIKNVFILYQDDHGVLKIIFYI